MLDPKLKIFHTAAEVCNFTETAAMLGMSQPNVTQQLAALEKQLNVQLFDRQRRRIALTAAGKVLQQECRHLFELENDILLRMRSAAKHHRNFILGGTPTAGSYLLIGLISLYQKRYPDDTLSLKIRDFENLKTALAAGELELVLTEEKYDAEYFFHEPYCRDRLIPVCAPNYIGERISLRKYLTGNGKLILGEPASGLRRSFSRFLHEHHLNEPEPEQITESDSIDAVKSLAQSGCGLAILPELAVENELQFGLLQRCGFTEGEIIRNIDFVYRADGDHQFIDAFIAFCRQHKGISLQ